MMGQVLTRFKCDKRVAYCADQQCRKRCHVSGKTKSLSQVTHLASAYPGLCSKKQLKVLRPP